MKKLEAFAFTLSIAASLAACAGNKAPAKVGSYRHGKQRA